MYEASEILSSSFALRHHAWMQANAVSQRAAWVLMLRSLIYSVSNAYIDGRPAQNTQRICFGGRWDACSVWDTVQQLSVAASCLDASAAWVLVPRPLNYRLRDAASTHVAPRNGGTSVSAAGEVHEASGTPDAKQELAGVSS